MGRSSARRTDALVPMRMGPGAAGVGAQATAGWLRARSVAIPPATTRWHTEIAISTDDIPPPPEFDDTTATRFHLDLYSEEWGMFFCHGGKSSWIRVTDLAFVHGRDDFGLLSRVPPLRDVGVLMRELEKRHGIQLRREVAAIRTNLANAEPAIRTWIRGL